MIGIETSVLVRYLVGSPADQARRAAAVLDGTNRKGIPAVVLVELAHVLRTQYDVPRADILDAVLQLVSREDVEILGLPKRELLAALSRARGLPGAPLADAVIAATARASRALPVYTFDQGFERHGIPTQEP